MKTFITSILIASVVFIGLSLGYVVFVPTVELNVVSMLSATVAYTMYSFLLLKLQDNKLVTARSF